MTGRGQAKVSALETFSDSRQWMTGLMYTDMKSQTAYINTKNIKRLLVNYVLCLSPRIFLSCLHFQPSVLSWELNFCFIIKISQNCTDLRCLLV